LNFVAIPKTAVRLLLAILPLPDISGLSSKLICQCNCTLKAAGQEIILDIGTLGIVLSRVDQSDKELDGLVQKLPLNTEKAEYTALKKDILPVLTML